KNEVEVLKNLKHWHIIHTYGVYQFRQQLPIVMEYAEMGSLTDVLKDKSIKLDWKTRIRISTEIAKGIEFIHRNNLIHRDIKSMNMMMTSQLEVRVGDFG